MEQDCIWHDSCAPHGLRKPSFVMKPFFLEPRRRVVRHFIKVEKKYMSQEGPKLKYRNTTHTNTTQTKTTDSPQTTRNKRPATTGLKTNGQQPGHELLELWSPSRTPEPTFYAYSPKHSLNARPRILEHSHFGVSKPPMLPRLSRSWGPYALLLVLLWLLSSTIQRNDSLKG
jgi:hypothetical protein